MDVSDETVLSHIRHTQFTFVFGNHTHHFSSFVKLFKQSVYFLRSAATFGYSVVAAAIQQTRVGSFFLCHGENDGFNTFECVIVYFYIFQSLS